MTTSKKFQRTKEDFACEKCGFVVHGSGYTNHCPKCLWSKHVDINPGDRRATCCGLMQPTEIESKAGSYTVMHRCTRCGFTRRNKISTGDDFDCVIKISSKPR